MLVHFRVMRLFLLAVFEISQEMRGSLWMVGMLWRRDSVDVPGEKSEK